MALYVFRKDIFSNRVILFKVLCMARSSHNNDVRKNIESSYNVKNKLSDGSSFTFSYNF